MSLRHHVFTPLSESYEQAKIDGVRPPVITMVEPPKLPARPDPRRLPLKGVLWSMLGGMVAVFWAFGREMIANSWETDPEDYAEFAQLTGPIKEELRSLWRPFLKC